MTGASLRNGLARLGGLKGIGPGLVFMLASIGAQDFVSSSAIGASYGYSSLWTLVLIIAARYLIMESSARYVLATGENLLTGYGRMGRWVVWLMLLALLLRRHFSNLVQVLLLGSFTHILIPLPVASSAKIWSLLFWTLGFALMYWGRYELVERWSKPLVLLLGGCLVIVTLLARPDPLAIAGGLFIPSVPQDQGTYGYLFLVMALVGSSAGSVGNLKYAAFIYEKGWRDDSFLSRQRLDLLISVGGIFFLTALMQIAAASVLQPLGIQLQNVEDLIPIFSGVFGETGRIILGLGIWAAVFSTYLGTNTGYALMVSEIYHGFIRPSKARMASGGAADAPGRRPAYRWSLIWFCISPLYVLLTDWKPIGVTLVTASLMVVLLPVVVLVLLCLNNDKKRMGRHANGWGANIAMLLVLVTAAVLTYQNAVQLWTEKLAGLLR